MSNVLRNLTLSSPLTIKRDSAMLDLVVVAGVMLAIIFGFGSGTVSHHLNCGGTVFITPVGPDGPLGVWVGVGLGTAAQFSCYWAVYT